MTHGTSASPLHGPSDPVDMTGNEIGEDKNSERLIYQDALQVHEHLALLFCACMSCLCPLYPLYSFLALSWYDFNTDMSKNFNPAEFESTQDRS